MPKRALKRQLAGILKGMGYDNLDIAELIVCAVCPRTAPSPNGSRPMADATRRKANRSMCQSASSR